LNRFAGEIRNKLRGFTACDLEANNVLRVATANDATALLYEMDALLRDREERPDSQFGRELVSRPYLLAHVRLHGGCLAMSPTAAATTTKMAVF
jgi:hypothetical protein